MTIFYLLLGIFIGGIFAICWTYLDEWLNLRFGEVDQDAWDAHVADAVEQSETPLYDRIAEELTKNVDGEWADLNQGTAQ